MPRVTITLPEMSPQPYRFDLKRDVVTVGRAQDNDIMVGSGSVSGKHCEMHRVKGGYHLVDAGSTNGIKIDGLRHQAVVLHTGITVMLGDVEFGFTLSEEELALLASESEPTAKAYAPLEEVVIPDDLKLPELPPIKKEKRKERNDEYSESRTVTIGSGFILFGLVAVVCAFLYGANTRHEKDTGDHLLNGIANKEGVKKDAPTEVEDKADGGAE